MKRPDTVNQKVHVKLGDVLQLMNEWKVGQLKASQLKGAMPPHEAGRLDGLTYSLQMLGLVPEDSVMISKYLREGAK
jgi:hypothetical protein